MVASLFSLLFRQAFQWHERTHSHTRHTTQKRHGKEMLFLSNRLFLQQKEGSNLRGRAIHLLYLILFNLTIPTRRHQQRARTPTDKSDQSWTTSLCRLEYTVVFQPRTRIQWEKRGEKEDDGCRFATNFLPPYALTPAPTFCFFAILSAMLPMLHQVF